MVESSAKEPWGKSWGREQCHPLICHMVDTAAMARRLAPLLLHGKVGDALASCFTPLGDAQAWIAFLCGIHDLGKFSPTFQSLNLPLATERIGLWGLPDVEFVSKPSGVSGRVDAPHGLLTAFHIRNLLTSWGATAETAADLAAVLGGHHGYFPADQDLEQVRREVNSHGGRPWEAARTELVLRFAELCGLPSPEDLPWGEVRLSLPAAVGLAALTTVSDWVASDERNYVSPDDGFDLEEYVALAQGRADVAVARLRLTPWEPPADAGFSTLFGEVPRPVQKVVEDVVARLDGPVLVLVEAPTGEGKTKAALQAAAALVKQQGLAGFYVALPTQASSRQVHRVVETMLESLGDSTGVSLVYAGAQDALAEMATPSEIGVDEVGDSDVAARAWFTRKRSLLAVLGSGTVDQPLKSAFRSGHVFVRLAGLAGKVVVIDEVHAYDVYMSASLQRLLAWLGALGVPVVLLSATLPASRRHDLVAAWQAGAQGCRPQAIPATPTDAPYPRVTVAHRDGVSEHTAGMTELNSRRVVEIEHVPDDEVVDWLLSQAAQDRCAAVVHNLVRRAIDTYTELERRIAALPEVERPLLFAINGTLPLAVRRTVETELRAHFGKDGARPRRAIVVGTQVLEQSLDLDFDQLLTDLAPIDSLIQRTGRVQRHDRRPGRGPLVMAITGVIDTPTGPRFPQYLHAVYAPIVLMRTWALLKGLETIDSWTTAAELVDEVYGDRVDCPAGWETAWDHAARKLAVAQHNDARAAELVCLPLPHLVEELFEFTQQPKPIRTRKGSGDKR